MATITLYVFNGNRPEILPNLCMYCGDPLEDERFAGVTVQIGNNPAGNLYLPICCLARLGALPDMLVPDGRNRTLDALAGASTPIIALGAGLAGHLAREPEGREAKFTFHEVHPRFARELDRLRNLTPEEYEQMMAEANAAFAARIGAGAAATGTAEERAQRAQAEALDSAIFGMDQATGAGELSVEVTRSNRNKLLLVVGLVGVAMLAVSACGAVGLLGYTMWKDTPRAKDAFAKTELPPQPKEQQARIKEVDPEQKSLKLLVGPGKYKTYPIAANTELFDAAGGRLDLKALVAHRDADVMILLTEDREGLQWLKLTK